MMKRGPSIPGVRKTAPRTHGGGNLQPKQRDKKGWMLTSSKPRLETEVQRLLQQFAKAARVE